ncbi:MAG: Ig-like domain-containing protein [Muribaculaceae bacterium]|nr:Ig-like domain-containing protein [Muribaculaceae bacterium]
MNKTYKLMLAAVFCLLGAFAGWAQDFQEDGIYYNILSGSTVEVTNSNGGTSNDPTCYSGVVVIPSSVAHDGVTYSVVQVANRAFRANTEVTSLTLPSTVTTLVHNECLSGMTALTYLEIPNVTTLPDYAMTNCTSLTELVLGEGVQWLGALMTNGCTALRTVRIQTSTPPGYNHTGTINTYAHQCKPFPNGIQSASTLYVPEGSVDTYKAKSAQGANNASSTKLYDRFSAYVEVPAGGGDEIEVESVTITPENPVLAAEEGATVQLAAAILPTDATYQTVAWTTSDATIATVNDNGLVTRTATLYSSDNQPYTVDITATAVGGVSATVTVTVNVLETVVPESVTIEPANPVLTATEGATVQLTATVLPESATDKSVTWSSADETIATVDANGLVTRVAGLYSGDDQPYTVDITATTANGLTNTVTVTAQVLETVQPTAVTIEPENPELAAEEGATVQLTATVLPETATIKTVTWSSADETIATVDANGLVTRVAGLFNENDAPYTVDITATAANGVSQTVTVTVKVLETVLPTAISISPENPVLAAENGATVQLTVVFDPETTTERTVTWSSADETIATVDQNGLVTRVAPLTNDEEQPFTVVITATTPNDLSADVTVTANIKGDEFFYEDGLYYNVLSHDNLTVEVTNSGGGTGNEPECYSGEITIPLTVTHKNRTYQVVQIGNRAFSENTEVTKLTLQEGLLSIAPYGVRGMSAISELTIPSTVTTLEAFTLARLSAETITIPNVAMLQQSLLSGCTALKHLILGEGVREIGNNMTKDVTTVEDVTCYATTPPVWDGSVANFAPFAGFISTAKLYVPEGCIDTYYNKVSNNIYYWRFGTIEEIGEQPIPASTLSEALASEEGTEVRISDELFIAAVETDGTAILTDNNGNWVATNFDNEAKEALGVGANSVKAGTLQGTITNLDTNPVIALTKTPEAGESTDEPILETLNLHTATFIDLPGNCLAQIAGFYGADGYLRAFSNLEDPGQRIAIDNTFMGEGALDNYINMSISFNGIIKLKEAWEAEDEAPAGAPRRVKKSDMNSSTNYTITPLSNITSSGDITTGVNDINVAGSVTGVKYINVMGQVSNRPFNGVNIVVTRNADGTVTTTKIVK